MPQSIIDSLVTAVDQRGADSHRLACGEGELLFVREGARLLAATLPGVEENLFWHDPASLDPSAEGPIWGGDRLWIAPEVAYMWEDLDQAREDPILHYDLPPAMDPAQWKWLNVGRDLAGVVTDMRLTDHRRDAQCHLRVERRVTTDVQPSVDLPEDVRHLGFTLEHDLTLLEADEGVVAGAWSLLQLPPTATLTVPTTRRADVRSYYDPFGDHHLAIDDERVRFLIDGHRRVKMGLAPDLVLGRMACHRPAGDSSTLVVRSFLSEPGRSYVDFPRDEPADKRTGGDAVQAYNDNGDAGGFGEMEHHDPALLAEGDRVHAVSRSTTSVFAGPDQTLRDIGEQMLGVPIEPLPAP
ncbi:MAG: DUF6786 family protein [Phycisphaeraceae bacterium]|nr:DUF6786 family protein [Phycisphaeraceae bacterium]